MHTVSKKEDILILDDEASILEVLGQILTEVGYACTLTTSPLEALGYIKTNKYALLVTDLRMPEMHGNEVVRHAKEIDPDLAVIVVTGLMEVTSAIESMRAGADDYLLKPFNLSEICLSAERALERRRLIIDNRRYQQELESQVREATRELRETKEYLENLINSSVDAILTINLDGQITYANQGAMHMFGCHHNKLLQLNLSDLLRDGEEEVEYIKTIMDNELPLQNYETEFHHKQIGKVPVNMSMSWIKNAEGNVISYFAICKDITEQKRLEADLKDMSIKDNLTGLYNQRYFYDRLEAEMERARRQDHPLSMVLFDVDEFKYFNDSRGHLEGDRVLQTIGEVVNDCTRQHVDLGFRYGGDEFTVILPEADEEIAILIAERIRCSFLAKQFERLTLSIGVATYQKDPTAQTFIRAADVMMYEAKRAGGNQIKVFNPNAMPVFLISPEYEEERKATH